MLYLLSRAFQPSGQLLRVTGDLVLTAPRAISVGNCCCAGRIQSGVACILQFFSLELHLPVAAAAHPLWMSGQPAQRASFNRRKSAASSEKEVAGETESGSCISVACAALGLLACGAFGGCSRTTPFPQRGFC